MFIGLFVTDADVRSKILQFQITILSILKTYCSMLTKYVELAVGAAVLFCPCYVQDGISGTEEWH